ncbi:polysaccharide deacetylase family protein [Xanthobacter sp. DSM 14520]|uniref:polysaccharide deacetylase family protein n=1 Tax=Xanthobacter autotrophicus (strain ATCC BAA-1158 / Py2) TaxID=78245 RepID=UPI0037291A31
MKASWGFLAFAAVGVIGLGSAFGQTFQPSPAANKPLATMTPTGTFAASQAAAEPPAPAAGMSAPAATPAPTGTSPQKLVAYSSAVVDGPYIAMTFDDGPNPETTPRLLKMLEQRGIKATFFVLGSRATASPAIIKQMIAQGHEVANHSWDHPQLPKIPVAAADKQIGDTNAAIEQITGKSPIYVRPPYGAMTPALRAHLREKFGSTFIYWSVDPLDWKDRNAQVIHDRIVSHAHPGAIVLAHDIHPTTVDAMPKVLDDLKAKGYKFVTVSELIAMNKGVPEPKVASTTPAPKKKPKPANPASASAAGANGTAATPVSAKPASAKPASAKPATPTRNSSTSMGLF